MQIKIRVTKEHITTGRPEEQTQCPVALAIRDQVGVWTPVYIDEDGIFIPDKRCTTPASVECFISKFDKGFDVEPFEFNLFLNKDEVLQVI